MAIKSYPITKNLNFSDLTTLPVFLGLIDGRNYFSFADGSNPPAGGKAVSSEDLSVLQADGQPFKHIKQEAEKRILNVAPLWRQQNALVDLYLLGQKDNPTSDDMERIADARALLEQVQTIRDRSNEIETTILKGNLVDYQTDTGWNDANAE